MNVHVAKRVQVPPSVLFPTGAPAGWSWSGDPLSTGFAPDPFASAKELWARAQDDLRRLAAALFSEAMDHGLAASEAADMIVRDGSYLRARATLIARDGVLPPRPAPTSARQCFSWKLLSLSPRLARLFDAAVKNEAAMVAALSRLAHLGLEEPIPTSTPAEDRDSDPLWFLSDPLIPASVMEGMLASHRAYAMSAAIDGFVHEQRWRLQRMLDAAQVWADESRSYLCLVASLPGTSVPDEVVSQSERLDLVREVSEQATLTSTLRSVSLA